MEHPADSVAPSASSVIAHLRESVQAWIDSDRVLPADGAALQSTLDQLQEGLAGEDAPVAQAAMQSFIRRVQELMQAGLLVAADHPPPLEAAAMLIEGLPATGGIDQDISSATMPGAECRVLGERPTFPEPSTQSPAPVTTATCNQKRTV
jgi:hypothetical protein